MKQIGNLKLFIRVINYKLIEDGTLSNIVNISSDNINKIVDYELFVVTNPKDSKYKIESLVTAEDFLNIDESKRPSALTGLDAMKFLFKQRNKNIDDFCIESIPIYSNDDVKAFEYKDEKRNINGLLELYRFIDNTNEAFVKLVDVDNYPEVLLRYKDLQEAVTYFYKYINELGE